MTKLIVLIVTLLSVSIYATSTKRICGNDGLNYDSYESIEYQNRVHMGYCGTQTQQVGMKCVQNVDNDCAAGLNCNYVNAHPCENVDCAEGDVCVNGECKDATLRCDYCKTNQLCIGGVCKTDCELTCDGTCVNNECWSNVGVCAEQGGVVDHGTGNECSGICCSSLTGKTNSKPMIFAFLLLLAITVFSRKKQQN